MAELLDSAALQQWLCDPLGETHQVSNWILKYKVTPYLSPASIGIVMHHYRADGEYSADQVDTVERLLDEISKEMRRVDYTRRVHPAHFDADTSIIWGKVAALPEIWESYHSVDLILAATAMRHGHRLVVAEEAEKMEALAGMIPPDLGRLNVISAQDLT